MARRSPITRPTSWRGARRASSTVPKGSSILTGTAGKWRERFLVEHWYTGFSTKLEAPTYSAVRTGPAAAAIPDRLYVEYRTGEWAAKEFYDRTIDPYELISRHEDPSSAAERETLQASLYPLMFGWGPWVKAAED